MVCEYFFNTQHAKLQVSATHFTVEIRVEQSRSNFGEVYGEVYYKVYMTRILHTARISNVESVMSVDRNNPLQTLRFRHCWS